MNRSLINFSSTDGTDNVIAVYTGSITIPVRTDPVNTETLETGLSSNPFFVGTYTVDGDNSRNDIGSYVYVDDGAGAPTEYGVWASASGGDIIITTNTSDTSTHTCEFSIAAIAQAGQGQVDISPSSPPIILGHVDGQYKYRSVASDDVTSHTVSSSSTSSTTISHSLGYKPSVLAFIEVDGVLYDATSYPIIRESGFTTCRVEVRVSTTGITYFFINGTGGSFAATLVTRIYYE